LTQIKSNFVTKSKHHFFHPFDRRLYPVWTTVKETMTLLPDDLCLLVDQMNISSSPSTASSPGIESPLPPQEYMTTIQRLHKLTELRTTMQQRLILLLTKVKRVDKSKREEIAVEVEEYRDLLDGMDVLIQILHKRKSRVVKDGREGLVEEWREMDEL
jgi:hypothetical protein